MATTDSYDPLGRQCATTAQLPSGAMVGIYTSVYDPAGRVTRALDLDGSVVTYGYDAASQLVNEWRSNPTSLTYAYGYNTTYTYDPVGNRLSSNSSGTVMTYTYNPANQLTGTTSLYGTRTTIAYDASGNDVTETSATVATTYSWDYDNRMTSAATTNYGGSFETYTYSADGLRQRKVNASGVTNYLWEGNNIVVETNAASVSLGRYTYGPGQWGMLISLKRDFPVYYAPDPQGNTRDLVYVYNGTPADDHYIFMAFGNELGPVGPSNNPYRYNGQWGYYRDVLNRMYVQARHLDAVKGRWLSEDPIGIEGEDPNIYQYVGRSPVSVADPSGLLAALTGSLGAHATSFSPLQRTPLPCCIGEHCLSDYRKVEHSAAPRVKRWGGMATVFETGVGISCRIGLAIGPVVGIGVAAGGTVAYFVWLARCKSAYNSEIRDAKKWYSKCFHGGGSND